MFSKKSSTPEDGEGVDQKQVQVHAIRLAPCQPACLLAYLDLVLGNTKFHWLNQAVLNTKVAPRDTWNLLKQCDEALGVCHGWSPCLWANSSQGLVRRVTRHFESTKCIPLDFCAYLVHAWKDMRGQSGRTLEIVCAIC